MSIKRTREDKLAAQTKRIERVENLGGITLRVGSDNQRKISRDTLLPVSEIKKDLFKTLFVTAIIISAQIFLSIAVNKGIIQLPSF